MEPRLLKGSRAIFSVLLAIYTRMIPISSSTFFSLFLLVGKENIYIYILPLLIFPSLNFPEVKRLFIM